MKKEKYKLNFDLSTWSLIIINLLTIVLAITEKWEIRYVFWIYFFQNLILGFFTFLKLIILKNYRKKDFNINGKIVEPTLKIKLILASFFIGTYLLFHLVYYLIIYFFIKDLSFSLTILGLIWIPTLLFLINHLFSFLYNYENDSKREKSFNETIFNTFKRAIGMHVIILFSAFISNLATEWGFRKYFIVYSLIYIIFFMIIKTIVDVKMHQKEHHV